jgi:uncharacterized protein (DUF427 family)
VEIRVAGQAVDRSRLTVAGDSAGSNLAPVTALRARAADLLTPNDSITHCPYKGEAEYWSLKHDELRANIAWSYRTPLPESQKIAGLICFYTDKVDLYIDDTVNGE